MMRLQPARLSDGGARRSGRGREAMWLYLVIAIAFLVMEFIGAKFPGQLRGYAVDIVSPVLSILERPVRAVQAGFERIVGVSDLYLENENLKNENERLEQWREAAMQLSRENDHLREILKVPEREVPVAATARVIGFGGGTFERSILLNAGTSDGVKYNQPVVDVSGLVGRIIQEGTWSSRVLLITDLNSRVPVRLERSGELGMAEGQNEEFLRLLYLPKTTQLNVGDRFLTSGHGGVFPPDIPVARVSEITPNYIYLEPLGLLGRLNYVRVMNYTPVPLEDQILEKGEDSE